METNSIQLELFQNYIMLKLILNDYHRHMAMEHLFTFDSWLVLVNVTLQFTYVIF